MGTLIQTALSAHRVPGIVIAGKLRDRAEASAARAIGGQGSIAIRASSYGAPERPIQIRSEALRAIVSPTGAAGWLGFAMPDDGARSASTKPAGSWRQADVRRAINAAEKAGLRHYRVEIAPDGTIAIVVGLPEAANPHAGQNPA